MGHRANFVIVENSIIKIYFSQGKAQETPNILAQGLAFCEKYFEEFIEESMLMDNAWAEGGILIDKDLKKVLIFGGSETNYTPALQRHYCKHMSGVWKSWSVQWCSQGIVDFAEHLGLMEDRILADGCKPEFLKSEEWSFTMDADRTQEEVITIIKNGIIADYKQDWGFQGINICLERGKT